MFASKVFCGWDFSIVSEQAAALNATSIYNEFKVRLNKISHINFSKAFDYVHQVNLSTKSIYNIFTRIIFLLKYFSNIEKLVVNTVIPNYN